MAFEGIIPILEKDNSAKFKEKYAEIDPNAQLPSDIPDLPEFLKHSPPILSAAAYYGARKIFNCLRRKDADITQLDAMSTPLSHFAAFGGNLQILDEIRKYSGSFAGAGFYAVQNKKIKALEWLNNNNFININEKDPRGFNYGLVAALTNNEQIIRYVYEQLKSVPNRSPDDSNLILYLLQNNMDTSAILTIQLVPSIKVNEANQNGETPLSYAKKNNKTEIIKLLEEKTKVEKKETTGSDQSKCCLLI